MQKLASLLFPVVFLFSFPLISMMNIDFQKAKDSEKNAEFVVQKIDMLDTEFYPTLKNYVSTLESEFDLIPEERKSELTELSGYISEKRKVGSDIQITVICTHNSRRSHMGQLWLWAAANYYGVEKMNTYSGGTEATAFNPRAVRAMRGAGFVLETTKKEKNPTYFASLKEEEGEIIRLFSKKYDDPANHSEDFAAVMVCTSADKACPIVPGADGRFAIPYRDPKEFDGSDEEESAYQESCRQIAREMFFVIKNSLPEH